MIFSCGFHLGKGVFFMNKKTPDDSFFYGRLFLRGKLIVLEPAAATFKFLLKKLESLRKKLIKIH